jgi:hypothetical protein
MKAHKRLFFTIGGLAGVVLAAAFWREVYDTLILPVALLLWAFLRLVLSLDQAVLWVLLAGMGFLMVIRRLSAEPAAHGEYRLPAPRPPMSRVAVWRAMITGASRTRDERLALQNSLTGLLHAAAALEEKGQPAASHDLTAALRQRLPDGFGAYFSEDLSGKSGRSPAGWKAVVRRVKHWIQRSTGKPPIDLYDSIEAILHHLETTLESSDESTSQSAPVL